MPGAINTFNRGMDKDTSKQKYPSDRYINGENIRPVTDEGLSTGAIENIAGNRLVATFPNIEGMFVITPNLDTFDSLAPGATTVFSVDVPTGGVLFDIQPVTLELTTPSKLIEDIQSIVIAKNNELAANNIPSNLHYQIGYLDTVNRLVIYNGAYTLDGVSTGAGYDVEQYLPARDFIIIGSAEMRDDIILFTKNVIGNAGFGQIWKFSYDVARPENDSLYEIGLIYHGPLNFSLEHPIEAVTRYENKDTIRVYFTDNFNPLRSCNIEDTSTFAQRSIDFALSPQGALSPAIATKKEHTGGNLPSGLIYVTYRLSKLGEGQSAIAPFSAAIPVIVDDPSVGIGGGDTEYSNINYASQIVSAFKSIDFEVRNIPEGFDKIIFYVAHEKEPANLDTYLYGERFLDNSTTYTMTISDLTDKEVVPFTFLVDNDVNFERVKTLTTKDNSLLVGNVKVGAFEIDFDSRAYGFLINSHNTYVGLTLGTNPDNIHEKLLSQAQLDDSKWLIEETDDVLNPWNDDKFMYNYTRDPSGNFSVNGFTSLEFRYQKNSTVLGGTGPNISYEFVSQRFPLDQSFYAAPNNERVTNSFHNERAPFVNNLATEDVIYPINGEDTNIGPGFSNFKNPTFEAYFKGYMRDEVYRFGIVFYSKTGQPSEVKWIADIRFPSAGDGGFDSEGFSDWGIAQWSIRDDNALLANEAKIANNPNQDETVGSTIGIKFDVDVSSISEQISGYSIVRAPRRQADRSIIAEGIQHLVDSYPYWTSTGSYDRTQINTLGYPVLKADGTDSGISAIYDIELTPFKWKKYDLSSPSDDEDQKNDLYIRDEIAPYTDQWKALYNNITQLGDFDLGSLDTYLKEGENIQGFTNWAMSTIDCPDLNVQSGVRISGYKDNNNPSDNSWYTGSVREEYYMIKPVALYSSLYPKDQNEPDDLLNFARTGGNGVSFKDNDDNIVFQSYDHVTKAVVLRGEANANARLEAAWLNGTLKDIFFVDHNTGGADYEEINYSSNWSHITKDTWRFRNAGILGFVANEFPNDTPPPTPDDEDDNLVGHQTFDGVGCRTVFTIAHSHTSTLERYHYAMTQGTQSDKYPFTRQGFAAGAINPANYQKWSYYGDVKTDKLGHYMIVDIYKYNPAPYGGRDYNSRQTTEYISCNNYTRVDDGTTGTVSSGNVFGGDIVVSLFTEKKFYSTHALETNADGEVTPFKYNVEYGQTVNAQASGPLNALQTEFSEIFQRPIYGTFRGICYPVQTVVNHELRPLTHLNNQTADFVSETDQRVFRKNPDEYATPILYHREKTTQTYLTKGFSNLISEYDNRIYMANTKTNGEFSDSWSIFEAQNYIDVEGEHGPINKLITVNEQVVYFQDKGVGVVSVNPRSIIPSVGGGNLSLGLSPGLVDYTYLSNNVGAFHQWGIVKGQRGVYFFDALHKKIFHFAGGNTPISDLKGMSSWCFNNLLGELLSKDNPLLFEGITTVYDHRFNEVIFTFHFNKDYLPLGGLGIEGITEVTDKVEVGADPPIDPFQERLTNNTNTSEGVFDGIQREGFFAKLTCNIDSGQAYTPTNWLSGLLPTVQDTILFQSPGLDRLSAEEIREGNHVVYLYHAPTNNYIEVSSIINTGDLDLNLTEGIVQELNPDILPLRFTGDAQIVLENILNAFGEETIVWENYDERSTKLTELRLVCVEYIPVENLSLLDQDLIFPQKAEVVKYTLIYNEQLQAFTSFYSHWPRHYFTNGRRIFSQAPYKLGMYVHDEGSRGQFYDEDYDSEIELLINPPGAHTKVFTNTEYLSQVYNNGGVNIVDETINKTSYFNEYQNTGEITLVPNANVKRRMRTWRMAIPRDGNARMRNPYMRQVIKFSNNDNKRIVLHDIITHYMDTPM